ncbi:MAG TPA: sulfite exporter TauE/SafE family protein [Kofleriaceae bacterium]|nr:sulfite exporter TauE/SafE family protein [Kofleriaceae bacterium]
MTTTSGFVLAGGAALVAGAVNAIAGGGSLITFPALVAAGLPPVIANVTNTVAMCPGYFGAFLAQRRDLTGQRARLIMIFPTGLVGGLLGALLLLYTGAAAFKLIVPYLILFAAALLALQGKLRAWMVRGDAAPRSEAWSIIPVGLTAIYGGYFGAGMGVMALAALAVILSDTLTRLNALKQAIALSSNLAAATFFACSGRVNWPLADVMFVAALVGGALGGLLASRIPAGVLRWTMVVLAVIVGVIYLVK